MNALKVRATIITAGTLSLGLTVAALAGPPVRGAFNAAHEAVRMSMLTRTMQVQKPAAASQTAAGARKTAATNQTATTAEQKTAATNQKATTATHTTGQPRQQCGSATAPNTPGHAASAPGSPFNPNGNAGTHYAGTQPQNSKNPTSAAQYDVACFNQTK